MEKIYVIKLRNEENKRHVYPSEVRYSASTVLGLGIVHIIIGALSLALGVMGLLLEYESNFLGSGIWIGVIFSLCGVFGLLASKKWYEDNRITHFFVACIVAAFASVVLLGTTVYCLIVRDNELTARRREYQFNPYKVPYSWKEEDEITSVISGNMFIICAVEFIWCVFSINIAWRGITYKSHSTVGPPSTCKSDKKLIVSTELPPGYSYSKSGNDIPDILTHVLNSNSNSYQVSRVNPLCSEVSGGMLPSVSSMDYRDRVQSFLSEAIELAKSQNSVTVDFKPPKYGSEFA